MIHIIWVIKEFRLCAYRSFCKTCDVRLREPLFPTLPGLSEGLGSRVKGLGFRVLGY